MGIFKKKKKNRVCVIGLDGVPQELILDLSNKGIMPGFKNLLEAGFLHKMKASLPEISSVSWTNFMTGANPGIHGIFGFTDLKENSYSLRFPNYLDLKSETFWDTLSAKKKKCIIINQPSTYPARKINGILISGFVAIELSKAVYPHSLKNKLEEMDYRIDIDTFKAREDHEILWKELDLTLQGRENAFDALWKEDWDYFEFVITGTDRLQHFAWNALEDPQHKDHPRILEYYQAVDTLVQKVVRSFQKHSADLEGLYILSDHGFTAIQQEVYLNAWLEQEGYLSFESSAPKNLDEISPKTKAFALDPNRIYIHDSGRYPKGSVNPQEKQIIKESLKDHLKKLEFNGRKIVRNVFDTNEIYSGPHVSNGPDLIVLSEYGYDMKGSVKKKEIFDLSNLQGMHTWDNAFFWGTKDQGEDLQISDLAPLIMEHFS